MPPLHPAFVHFPIALVAFSFVTDLLGRLLNQPSLRAAGFWSLIGALVSIRSLRPKIKALPSREQTRIDPGRLGARERNGKSCRALSRPDINRMADELRV
jgi:hypothetical protein